MLAGHLPSPNNPSITGLEEWIPTLNEANEACPWGEDGVMSPQPMVVGGLVMPCQRKLQVLCYGKRLRGYQ